MLEKTARDRTFWSRIYNKINLLGKLRERRGDFKEKMEALNEKDLDIREKAKDLKEHIKSAQEYLDKNELVRFFVPISEFYEKANFIANSFKQIKNNTETNLYKILGDDLDKEEVDQIQKLFSKAYDDSRFFYKKAFFNSWIYRNFTERGKALKELMNYDKKFFTKFKIVAESCLNKAKKLVEILEETLDKLSYDIARRQIEKYVLDSMEYISNFYKFKVTFDALKNKYIKEYMEKVKINPQLEEMARKDVSPVGELPAENKPESAAPVVSPAALPAVLPPVSDPVSAPVVQENLHSPTIKFRGLISNQPFREVKPAVPKPEVVKQPSSDDAVKVLLEKPVAPPSPPVAPKEPEPAPEETELTEEEELAMKREEIKRNIKDPAAIKRKKKQKLRPNLYLSNKEKDIVEQSVRVFCKKNNINESKEKQILYSLTDKLVEIKENDVDGSYNFEIEKLKTYIKDNRKWLI